jgi:peptidoglycan/xylan/chitin deacetylase (PgdA/CDA1 family)
VYWLPAERTVVITTSAFIEPYIPSDDPTEDTGVDTMLIALTFDDGPFVHTDVLLDILEEHNVRATFFVEGRRVENNPEMARRVFEAGHDVANHTWSHMNLGGSADMDIIREQLERTNEVIYEATGQMPAFFRPAYLAVGANLREVTADMGLPIINASSIGNDWENIAAEQVAANVLRAAQDGGIILLHEQHSAANRRTKDALPIIFAELWERGFEIVSLSELVERTGATPQAGVVYNNF